MEEVDSQESNIVTSNNIIQPINKDTVHKICSGQVVLSVAIAVKELVENAIDAGAKIISVHLKNYGADSIEVCDNGCGVSSEHFQVLTLKHYTSKLREFTDLEHIETLGFRGEALNSLCALSDVSIVTKHVSADIGSKITYNHDGKIVDIKPIAREVGTTVLLEKIFSTLPVRRKEFLKNLKREFTKMCHLLYAYCLVSKGVRILCTNITDKGSRNSVVATEGHNTVKDNILTVFGAKQVSTLINVDVTVPEEHILAEYAITLTPGETLPFTFDFFISSVMHGSGRSSTDRQFYFINSRPCEPKKVMKLVNEIYKQFNSKQYPFVFLNITTVSAIVDVNVTPDKRQIFLQKEKYLLAILKASLLESFKAFPSTYKLQNMELRGNTVTNVNSLAQNRGLKRALSDSTFQPGSIVELFQKRSKSDQTHEREADQDIAETSSVKTEDPEKYDSHIPISLTKLFKKNCEQANSDSDVDRITTDNQQSEQMSTDASMPPISFNLSLDDPKHNVTNKKYMFMGTTVDSIKEALRRNKNDGNDKLDFKVRFHSQIASDTNKAAEEELQKQIAKEDFKRMDIIGQFNLGFIITKLDGDLFIVDQHATDEKYNFEQLYTQTVLESQKLVHPKPLELTPGNECILIENEHVFNRNGFIFSIDDTAPCTKKVSLIAVPVIKNTVFGPEDIVEMLFMLQESESSTMCRPSKVRTMFASKACRKSVMVGTPLSTSDMKKLIDHMSEIDQPWNCPHGRPTMRHLINLDLIGK